MKKKLATLAALGALSSLTQADVLQIDFSVNVTSVYDFAQGTYRDITPVTGVGSVFFDPAIASLSVDGANTVTSFGSRLDTRYTPYPGAPQRYGLSPGATVLAKTYDTDTAFVQQSEIHLSWSPIGNGPPGGSWDFYLAAQQTSAPRTDSPLDQAFTSENIVSFYQGLAASGTPLVYLENSIASQIYDPEDELYDVVGTQWADNSARIVGLALNGVTLPVPEPSIWALMGLGLSGIGFAARRKRTANLLIGTS